MNQYNAMLITRPLANIPREAVTWLWPNRIPLGKITVIAGDPGLGKSLLTANFAATVSRGCQFPDGTLCAKGDVLLLSAEDDPGDTIRPRLEAMDADLDRVHFCSKYAFEDGDGALCDDTFTDVGNTEAIARSLSDAEAAGHSIRLIVIDPITAFLGDLDGHKNTEIRARLAPLAELAQQWRCAVVMVSHLNKAGGGSSPIYRITGSLAFVAAARAVWLVTRDPDDQERRLFLPIKANLGPDSGGLAYRISGVTGVAQIEWDGIVDISAAEAMRQGSDDERSELRDAIDFLRELLADGPMEQKQIEKDATSAGISMSTLRRAKKQAGIKSEKAFGNGKWRWSLPERQGDHYHPAQNHDHVDHHDQLAASQHDQLNQRDQDL